VSGATRAAEGGAAIRRAAAAALAAATVAVVSASASACVGGHVDDSPRVELPLPIPPVLAPTHTDGQADYYTITQRPGLQQVFPAHAPHAAPTPVEGYEGAWPGPTIHARRGRPAIVTQVNALSHPVVVHNHGHKVPADSDGHPVALIQPGASRDYRYPNDQLAGTFWLHDHTMNETGPNLWRGLSMFYVIHDDVWDGLRLPSGEYDVPLLLQDRSFNADNTFFFPAPPQGTGPAYGDTMCVNGARTPRLAVASRKYLFRLLNGSDHRIFRLSLQRIDAELGDDAPMIPFKVVASDGGLLPSAVERTELVVAPAERYAIVVDFSQLPIGASLVMHNRGPDANLPAQFATGVPSVALPNVMRFDVARAPPEPDTSVVPNDLLPIQRYDPADAVVTRRIELGGADSEDTAYAGDWYLNHRYFDPARIDFYGKLGTTEIWELVNPTGANHVMHVHLTQFQVLDNGAGTVPPPEWSGWKDSLLVRPLTTARIILKWEGFTGVYVFHCHVIGHEDRAMMGQVQIDE